MAQCGHDCSRHCAFTGWCVDPQSAPTERHAYVSAARPYRGKRAVESRLRTRTLISKNAKRTIWTQSESPAVFDFVGLFAPKRHRADRCSADAAPSILAYHVGRTRPERGSERKLSGFPRPIIIPAQLDVTRRDNLSRVDTLYIDSAYGALVVTRCCSCDASFVDTDEAIVECESCPVGRMARGCDAACLGDSL